MVVRDKNMQVKPPSDSTHVLCELSELDDPSSKGFTVSINGHDIELFLVHKEGKIRAYLNRCPHTGGTLDWNPDQFLDEDNEFIICANHAALFEIANGLCVAGPCVNQRLQPVNACVEEGVVYFLYQQSE